MKEDAFKSFLALSERGRRDVFETAAYRLDTLPSYVEKDFWVCFVLDALYNRLPDGHPRLLFKGGTSLSKAFGLIRRFSEDIDLVVRDLGFAGDRDPIIAGGLSNKKRNALFKELAQACGGYVLGGLNAALSTLIGEMTDGCEVLPDEDNGDGQTLLVSYLTLYPGGDAAYVSPRVKIEAGARSALEPNVTCAVRPYVADDLPDWPFDVGDIATLAAKRTYWEKLLILHGVHCGYRDEKRLPTDKDRISRHYYDAATMTASGVGDSALSDEGLLDAVRNHNLVAFRQAWKRFEEAVSGAAGSAVGTAYGDRARLPDHAGHDPRRRPGVRMGPASPRGNRDKLNVTVVGHSRIRCVANVVRGGRRPSWRESSRNALPPPAARGAR